LFFDFDLAGSLGGFR